MSNSPFSRERVSSKRERKLITFCITSTEFLRAMRPILDEGLFQLGYSATVWGWCKEYWDHYQEAPGRHVEDLFQLHASSMGSEDAEMLRGFLSTLSHESDVPLRMEYDLNNAVDWALVRKAEVLRDVLDQAIASNDGVAIEAAVKEFQTPKLLSCEATDVFNNVDAVVTAFDYKHQRLLKLDGAFGDIIGWINREDFILFQGFAKARKSWFLQHIAQEGADAGLNVLVIDFEMSRHARIRRIWTGLKQLPKEAKRVKIPVFYKDDEDDPEEKWKIQMIEKDLPAIEATPENVAKWQRERSKYYRKGGMRIAHFPANTLDAAGIVAYAKNLEYFEGFKVDLLVVDYPDKAKGEGREEWTRSNSISTALRASATQEKWAVVGATQSNRDAADGQSSRGSVAGDIRKVAEVTALIVISSTPRERRHGLIRLKNEAVRDEAEIFDSCYVTSCLDIGKPVLDSRFVSDVELPDDDEDEEPAREERPRRRGRGGS